MSDEIQTLIREARRQGWRVEQSNGGHLKWFPPDSPAVLISAKTASDWRSLKNHLARMRKHGFQDPKRVSAAQR